MRLSQYLFTPAPLGSNTPVKNLAPVRKMQNDKPNLLTPIRNFLKENFKSVLATLLSSIFGVFTITYIITSTFMTSYITSIGLGSIKSTAVINESTTHSIIWNLTLLVGILIYIFCITPLVLRFLYSESKNKYFKFQRNQSTNNKVLTIVFLIACVGLFPLVFFALVLSNKDANLSLLTPLGLTIIIYITIWIKSEKNSAFYAAPFYYSVRTLIFCIVGTLTSLPFYFLLSKVDYSYFISNIPKFFDISGDFISFITLWLVYAIFYGSRIHLNSLIHYVLDIAFIGFFLIFLTIFSPKTFMLPLVEMTGIKDDHPHIYKVNQENFEKNLADEIPEYWRIDFKEPENFCANSPKLEFCPIIFVNQIKGNAVKNIYFNAVVIYRDEKRVSLCPPTIEMGKMLSKEITVEEKQVLQSTCIILPADILEPTPLTFDTLASHRNSLEKK